MRLAHHANWQHHAYATLWQEVLVDEQAQAALATNAVSARRGRGRRSSRGRGRVEGNVESALEADNMHDGDGGDDWPVDHSPREDDMWGVGDA